MPLPTIPPPADVAPKAPAPSALTSARAAEIFTTRAEPALDGDARLRSRLTRLTLARLGAITGVLAVVLVGSSGAPSNALVATIVVLYVVSIAYAWWLSRGRDLRRLALLQIALDVSAYIAVAIVTGGPVSPLGFFVAVPALSAALVLGSTAARVTAAASAISYGAVTVAFLYRWPHGWWSVPKLDLSRDELAVQLVAHGVAIPLVAALGSALAERLRRAGGALVRLEEQRADLVALHEDVLRSIPVGLLTINESGEIDGANPEAELLLGLGAPSLLGAKARAVLSFIDEQAWSQAGVRHGEAKTDEQSDALLLAWSISELVRRSGAVRGQLVVLEDRSQAAALRAQIERAEKLAVLGRLAAGLAHEIRNPLGAISGCVELVREGAELSVEDKELLGTVLRESQRLNRLVGDMLAFARPRPTERVRVELVGLLREFVSIASRDDARSAALVREEQCESSVHAMVDRALIQQVLWNLFRNAAQASSEGSKVELWAAHEDGAPALYVADRGAGIARESRERIFETFYSEGSARGTGLGLALVRQIADAHGATIEPREREGGGTVFVLRFAPLDEGQPA
jgi:two-component system sensor histidine kinase PilS (NtrC family)